MRAARWVYAVALGWQDDLIRALLASRLRGRRRGVDGETAERLRRWWYGNALFIRLHLFFGLTTQYAFLSIMLVLGEVRLYLEILAALNLYLVALHVVKEVGARRLVRRRSRGSAGGAGGRRPDG